MRYGSTLLLRNQERIVNGLEFQSLFPNQKGFSLFNRDVIHDAMFDAVIFSYQYRDNVSVHVMTLCPPVFNFALPRIGVLQPGTKTSRGLANVLGHYWATYNPLFGLRIQVRSRSWRGLVHHSV